MIFSRNENFNDSEINLVRTFLEDLIGNDQDYCRNEAEEQDFIYLDHWNNKMGFVKEDKNRYLILSLQFENNECYFYQLIIKEPDEEWLDGKVIDYNVVRELGIVEEEPNERTS